MVITREYDIGVWMIDDFLSKNPLVKCSDFKETSQRVEGAFKMYLGVAVKINFISEKVFVTQIDDNPLAEFVELPENLSELWYSNMLVGILRGCLERVHLQVEATFLHDVLKGDSTTEIKVKLLKYLEEQVPQSED